MTTFLVSPPTRKPAVEKLEKIEEVIPRLILAPFSPQAEVKFGEVTINSVQWKPLVIFNPSTPIIIQFTNINPDDRISLNECKIQIGSREEKQVLISWSPLQSGYLRKVIRAQDSNRKAKSFDVVLSGMAVNKGIQNSRKRKMKSETNTTQLSSQKSSNTTVTLNSAANQKLFDLRRETFTIEEKENRLPASSNLKKQTVKPSSPPSDSHYLNVLNENSISTNFSRNCSYDTVDAPVKYSSSYDDTVDAPVKYSSSYDTVDAPVKYSSSYDAVDASVKYSSSYDTVDAPTKYSSFESEFNGSRRTSVNSNLIEEMDLRRSTFSINLQNHIFSPPKNCFSNSLEEERSSTPTENICEMNNDDVKLTPLKVQSESFLFSPHDNQQTMTSSINTVHTKSISGFSSIEESFVSNFSFKPNLKDDVFCISPPAKLMKSNRRLHNFVHRTESSAIKDRRKHIRTSMMSRKKLSPKKLLPNGRSTTLNASTVERIKSQNPQALKQVVPSQGPIEDPFVQHNDQWLDEQEENIIKWMNSILVPVNLNEEQSDWTVDGAEAWIKRNYSSNSVLATNKVPITLYPASENLDILRKRNNVLLKSDFVKVVLSELSKQVKKKVIFVREGRDIYADEGIKTKLLQLLGCYNPVWLRLGLEAIYEQEIPLQPKADFGGLGLFIRKKVIVTSSFLKKTEAEKEATRKMILLKFLQLIFFLDQARLQRVIRHNPCLFNLNSKYKASQNLLAEFCSDLVSGRGYVMKQLKNVGYVLQFKQTCIDEYDYKVTTLKDLNDGVRLARLFEILFSESGLCAKLRVPAIDIENKKYNIEVAMRAAKARCTIKGCITAEDFVLVTRLGSRLKILSFLWQIIYNYLTPLYEKAAIKIQKWWRKHLVRCKMVRLQDQQIKEKSARIIQSAWRKHSFRTQIHQLIPRLRNQRQKEDESARIIQTRFRAFLAMKRDRDIYRRKIEAVTIIQRWCLSRLQRKRFIDMKNGAVRIQQWYRNVQTMKAVRSEYTLLKVITIKIQRRFRANQLMKQQRQRYMRLRWAAVEIQRQFRCKKAAKAERKRYLELRSATLFIQRQFRANQKAVAERNEFMRLKNAALVIQRRYRATLLMREERRNFLALQKSATAVQRIYRAKVLMRSQRKEIETIRNSTIKIQRSFRARQLMKVERRQFLELKAAAIVLQRQWRIRMARNHFLRTTMRLKNAALVIQRRYRATLLMREERRNFLALKTSAITVQRIYKAKMLMRSQRKEFETIRNSTIKMQRSFRARRLMKVERRGFLELKAAAIVIQRQWRTKMARNHFLRNRKAISVIQRWWLRIQAVKRQQRDQQILRQANPVKSVEELAAIKIQTLWRGYHVRKMALVPKRKPSDSKLTEPQSTLGERYRKAIDQIKTSDMYSVIFNALWNLEKVTTFSAKLCEGVAAEGIVPIVFGLMSRGNRSEPSLELYRSSISILINLTLYPPTKFVLWDSLSREIDVALVIHLMKVTYDKFFKKNDLDVFRYSTTFLWLLCQEEAIAECIANLPSIKFHLEKMKISLEQKCPCRKNNKGKPVRKMLPKTETNWYADAKTRTFDDNCFAILNLYNSLYHRK